LNAYVLDASVAAKWFLPAEQEPFSAESLRILEGYSKGRIQMMVPDLFWPELGNVLWKAVRLKRISSASAAEAIAALVERRLPTAPTSPLLKDAFAIAARFDRAVYDCIYVALAVTSGRPLLTADERLANALAARFPVRWLGAV
jgi:predicted nucleic acid-binding protein